MTRAEIETTWPLVVKHRDVVLRFLEFPRTATQRKLSRLAVLDDYQRLRDVTLVAARHHASPSGIQYILRRACRAARCAEAGTLRIPRPRRRFTLTLTEVPARLIADVDAWAQMRGLSRREAAVELVKLGLDATARRHVRR